MILQGPLMKTPIDDFKPSTSLKDKHLIEKVWTRKVLNGGVIHILVSEFVILM